MSDEQAQDHHGQRADEAKRKRTSKALRSAEREQAAQKTPSEVADPSRVEPEDPETARLARYDENAATFAKLEMLIDEEIASGHVDEELRARVLDASKSEIADLFPEARVEVVCGTAACEVRLDSEVPVGKLLVKIGAWLRAHPEGAVGDPRQESLTGFRVLFRANEAPGAVPE